MFAIYFSQHWSIDHMSANIELEVTAKGKYMKIKENTIDQRQRNNYGGQALTASIN